MAVEPLVGPLPAEWEYTTLGDACQRHGGGIQTGPFGSQLHAADYVPEGIPSIMPQNIRENRVSQEGIARITATDAQRLSRYLVTEGDIVYSRRGDVEKRALIREDESGWLCGTGCLRIRFGKDGLDPLYASYYLGHPNVREWVVRHAHGATMPNLNTSILSALPLVVPTNGEQRAIAHILGTLDDKIELIRQMNETLEGIARALFKSWFVDFDPVRAKAEGRDSGLPPHIADLFPSRLEPSELGEIPVGWEVVRLGDAVGVVDYVANGSFASLKENVQLLDEPGYALYVRTTDFNSGFKGGFRFVSQHAYRFLSKSALNGSEVIISNVGDVGTVFRPPKWLGWPMTLGSNAIALRVENSSNYLYGYFRDHVGQSAIGSIVTGSAQPKFNKTNFRDLRLLFPSTPVLQIFERQAAVLWERECLSNKEGETLAGLRDALLPKLISGEVRVWDAERFTKEVV